MKNNLGYHFIANKNDSNFIYEIETKKSMTYGELKKRIKIYQKKKILIKAKKVSIILENSIEYVEFFTLSQIMDFIFHPIPYYTSPVEIKNLLNYFNPDLVITDRKDLTYNKKKIYKPVQIYNSDDNSYDNYVFSKNFNRPATMYNSSGTTGKPKGILYSYSNIFNLAKGISHDFNFSKNDKHLIILPLGHTASLNYNLLPSLYCGSTLYISKGFSNVGKNFFKILKKFQITYTQIVPTIVFHVNKLEIKLKSIPKKIRFIGCGSSYLPIESQIEFMKKYKIKVTNLYGLSETGPSHFDDPSKKRWKPGSIGLPLKCNKCKLSKDKEIMIKGKTVFVGYYKNKKEFNKVVKNGWFYTGDYGYKKQGKYYFSDRKKDIIIRAGINIFPSEIENVVHGCKDVKECVVFPKINNIGEEEIGVAVVKRLNKINNNKIKTNIMELCIKNLSKHKIPNYIYIVKKIPKTPSNKLLRRKIREAFN